MKRQLLKKTVELIRIVVLPRKKEKMQDSDYPTCFMGAFEVKHFCFFFLENMKLDLKITNANCSDVIKNEFV